ncbi:MAG: hypothetical protein ABSE85_11435 [Candidatus Korobacteraceae bacterium]|jgi:hypothetical protein
MSLLDRIFGRRPPTQSSATTSPIDQKSPLAQVAGKPPDPGTLPNFTADGTTTICDENALAQKEEQIQQALQRLQNEIKARPEPLLPLVNLALKETPLGKLIVWCFATEYGVSLNIKAAELVMNQVLKPYGIVVSEHSYMGGPGARSQLFSYRAITADSLELEAEVKRFDELSREKAVEEAKRLLQTGQIRSLVGWLCYGKYCGIPAEILRTCQNAEASQSLISLLADNNLRERAAQGLGPLGGAEAARALSDSLKTATLEDARGIAKALGRLAWPGAAAALATTLDRASTAWDRCVLAEAMVRCGSNDAGFDVLFRGLTNDDGSNEFAGALSRLDEDDIRDARLVTEMRSLVERTSNNNASSIAIKVLKRHGIVDEKNCLIDVPALVARYAAPRHGGQTKSFNGFVSVSFEEASAITGIPVDEIRELAARKYLFSHNGGSLVQVHGEHPRGTLLYHANPRWRSLGTKPIL